MAQTYTDDCFATDHVVQTDMGHIEENFAALKSAFSGANAPSNMVAGMWWFDTAANILKLRNEANSVWQSVWNFASNKPLVVNILIGDFPAAMKDPAAGTAGFRTLGTGAAQAGAGNVVAANTAKVTNATHTGNVTGSTSLTIASAVVSQTKLKTSIGSVSTANQVGVLLTLPGGTYGFYPQIKSSHSGVAQDEAHFSTVGNNNFGVSYITRVWIKAHSDRTVYARQRYVTASGEIHWVFFLRDRITKQTISMYQAPDHPCLGNGGKPLLVSHPFGEYDETKYEVIVINPTNEEVERMELETIVDDETKPDKDLLEVIAENYEIDEDSNPAWPTKPVTVGLPKHVKDKKTGKKVLADYRFMSSDTIVEPVKKIIPKPSYIKVKKLRRK